MLAKLEEMILFAVYRHGPEATAADVQAALSDALGREQAFGLDLHNTGATERQEACEVEEGRT